MKTKVIVPSQDYWERGDVLRARNAQFEAAILAAKPNESITHPGRHIMCDGCGDSIDSQFIHLVQYGRRIACQTCWENKFKNEPITYRELNEDGSLGYLVKGNNE